MRFLSQMSLYILFNTRYAKRSLKISLYSWEIFGYKKKQWKDRKTFRYQFDSVNLRILQKKETFVIPRTVYINFATKFVTPRSKQGRPHKIYIYIYRSEICASSFLSKKLFTSRNRRYRTTIAYTRT